MNSLKFASATIATITGHLGTREISSESPDFRQGVDFHKTLEIKSLSYRYPGSEVDALTNVSLQIIHGSMVGFMGKSGSGKTTLIDVILGLLVPSHGQVLVDGTDIRRNLREWQSHVGYIPQTIYLVDDSIRRNVALGLPNNEIDEEQIWRSIEAARLAEFVRALPEGANTIVGERGVRLSGGQRQRVGIARALYRDPSILIFDEATSALDHQTEQEIVETIRGLHGKKTIMMIAHRHTTLDGCDRVFCMDRGQLVVSPGTAEMTNLRD